VFDTLNFEVQGKSVILSGQVVKESVKERAERAVKRIDGVESVVNHIEILPSSRRDDALRANLYRAIYQGATPAEVDGGSPPFVHIIVKDGSVTLEGVVRSDADRSAIYVKALNVTAHVTDKLRVSTQP
jgi:osmotically-inducible protein OsmY